MTTFFGDNDIPAMIEDFGVPFIWKTVTLMALVDYEGENYVRENNITGISGRKITAYVQTSAVAGIANGDSVTVDGTDWKVRDSQQVTDGAITHVLLATR